MGFDSSIRKKVRALAKDERDKLKEEEIYKSTELKTYLENLSSAMMEGEGEISNIFLVQGEPNGDVAFTTGNAMMINWNSHIITHFPTPEQRFVAFMGLFFHEKAHDLFCDFNEERRAIMFLEKGNFYGAPPTNLTKEEDRDWTEMQAAMENPNARQLFASVFKELSNIVDDTHDEDALMDEFGSFVSEGIFLCRNALQATAHLYEDMEKSLITGNGNELSVAYNLLLQTTRFGYALSRDPEYLDQSRFGDMLRKVQTHAEIACVTDDTMRRFSELTYIMIALWPFIRSMLQNMQQNRQGQQGQQGQSGQPNQSGQQNQSGNQDQNGQPGNQGQLSGNGNNNSQNQNSQTGNGDPGGSQSQQGNSGAQMTAEQLQQLLEALKAGSKNSGQTKAPEKKESSQTAIERRAAERKGEERERRQANGDQKSNSSEAIYAAFNSIAQQIAEHKAEQKMEAEAKKQMVDAVVAVDQTSAHKGIPLSFTRTLHVSDSDRKTYEQVMEPLLPISKRLQNQIINALRDLKEGYVSKHKLSGKTLVVNDTYRPDGRYFSHKKLPQDLPDMAISVLIDHSGSMRGERIETAMRASMLLYDFATGVDIPISVAGHRSPDGERVEYIMYTDFEQYSKNDRYRLSKMSASGNNRDGMALNIAAGLLDKRPEQVKLLIIISDGRPNHLNYGGAAAAKDIQDIIKSCRRRGIEVIAAAIGNDRKQIQDIYKDSFLDISDLAKLPKLFVNIVKKRILRNAL